MITEDLSRHCLRQWEWNTWPQLVTLATCISSRQTGHVLPALANSSLNLVSLGEDKKGYFPSGRREIKKYFWIETMNLRWYVRMCVSWSYLWNQSGAPGASYIVYLWLYTWVACLKACNPLISCSKGLRISELSLDKSCNKYYFTILSPLWLNF